MIAPDAKLAIRRILLGNLRAVESRPRYPSMVMLYVQQMHDNPHDDPGLLRVLPSQEYRGLFDIDDGYHRYLAAIIVGRADALCLVIGE